VHEELDQTTGNACLDDSLDLVVGTIREVRNSPASIDEDLIVKRIDKLGEDGKSGLNLLLS
jgi:hypothetical protein